MTDQEKIAQAGETVFDTVYVPAFAKACAAKGVTFANEDELILGLQNSMAVKQAELAQDKEGDSIHKVANAALQAKFGSADTSEADAAAALDDQAVKEAVELLSALN